MNEEKLRKKFAEEKRDMIGNLHNAIIEAFVKYRPQPEVAVFVLEMAKFEVLNEVYRRQFTPKPQPPKPIGSKDKPKEK